MRKNLHQPLDLKAKVEQDIERNCFFVSCYFLLSFIAFYTSYIKQYCLTLKLKFTFILRKKKHRIYRGNQFKTITTLIPCLICTNHKIFFNYIIMQTMMMQFFNDIKNDMQKYRCN